MLRLVATLLIALPCAVLAAPTPPCDAEPSPSYGSADGMPRSGTWTGQDLRAAHWQPAACLRWTGDSLLVAAVASRFRANDDVFDRVGRVSAWSAVKYWSMSKQRWEPLVLATRQAQPPNPAIAGETLFVERDAASGEATYRMRVLERNARRLVVATENVTPIKVMLVTAFPPGSLQTVTFVQKEGGDLWSTYQLTRVGTGASSLVLNHPGSFLNRLEAIRRFLAGRPSDDAPPLAPR
jgi:hypothetical protein